jgi:uncharacterized protein YutE (UPF0331/DUF86 family)
VVDERRLRRLLQRIEEDLVYLLGRREHDRHALARDVDRLAALKYYLLTAIEGCLGVAQHLCSSEGWGPPSDNADAMRLLGRHGVLDHDHSSAMASAVRFRNVLVHEYVHIDDMRVVGYLDELGDIQRFVASVATWIDRQPR